VRVVPEEPIATREGDRVADEQDTVAVSQGGPAVEHEPPRSRSRRRGWLMRRLLLGADVMGLLAAYSVAMEIAPAAASTTDRIYPSWEFLLFAATMPVWILLLRVHGLYDRDEERTDHSTVDDIVGVFQVVTLGTWSFLVVTRLFDLPSPILERLVAFWLVAVVLIPLLRAAARAFGRRRPAYIQNVIIVGSGEVAHLLADKIERHPEYGLRVVGFVDRDDRMSSSRNGKWALLGSAQDLTRLVRDLAVDRVAIAFSNEPHERTLEVIRSAQESDIEIDIVPRMFEVLGTSAELHTIEGIPLVGLRSPQLSGSSRLLKRSFDVLVATLGLVLLAPLFIVVAVLVKLDSRGPVFFRQVRMGAGNRTFRIFKFRTMIRDAESKKPSVAHLNMHSADDPRMFKAPEDPRVTRVGAVLRRWRIDEIPQLFNVLSGEMSVVGPRPLILDEDQHVANWARRRLDLKPGMTGLWQVLGASDIPFEEMTKLDYLYVTNWSLREDLRLTMLTLPALFRSRSAY
jgi:exopolysaccharide biosynthesis polyprenyl glycosylphosphotransferase